jgi:phosphoribosyl-AMP cyclohydrolase / phosphoribosyl-ATP pyrophosphohydrolase
MSLRQISSSELLQFGKIIEPETEQQLLPVIVADGAVIVTEGLRAIRMQGYANREAVDKTFATGLVTFYSRSQRGLWTKGETSGNVLQVRAVYTDCDADSLLVDAMPIGPTCHTGMASCFEVAKSDTANEPQVNMAGYLGSLETIASRYDSLQAGEAATTYTQKLLVDQNARVKKLGTEAVELVREECRPDFNQDAFIGEAADLVYAAEVMVAARGIPFAAVLNELAERDKN